jgi:hypothetical protein
MGSTIDGMQLRSCEIEIEGVLSARLHCGTKLGRI